MSQPTNDRQHALEQEHPEIRPLLTAFLQGQEELVTASRKRDGILWRLDQIPDRAKNREGEERQKLLDRAMVLQSELKEALIETETLRLKAITIELDLRLKQLRIAAGAAGSGIIDEYEAAIRSIGQPSSMDPARLAEAVVETKQLYREAVLREDTEPGPELRAADERVRTEVAAFEDEQRQRLEVSQRFEPQLKRLLQPQKSAKGR